MNRWAKMSAACAAVMLWGCATAYQPAGATGGYTDQKIDDNTVEVSFRGNGFTAPEKVHYYLLRRCAEVTIRDGYNYFVIVNSAMPDEGNTNAFGAKLNDKYRATATIKMFKGKKPENSLNAYDAAQISKNAYESEPN
jgi:hypothetical protein